VLAVCRRRRRRGDSCPFQTLIDEKRKLCSEKREKQTAMKAEGDKHFEMLRAWRTYEKLKKDWDFQERRDRIAVEKKAREEQWALEQKKIEENTVPQHPCAVELNICTDLEKYLKDLLPKEQAKDVQAFVPVATKDDKGKMLKPVGKLANDEGFFAAPVSKGKKTKKADASASDKQLVHDLNTIGAFSKIKVRLPATLSDVPACLEAVEQAHAAFEARTEAEVETEDKQPRGRAAGHAETFPVRVKLTATAPDRVDVKVSVMA
jgi:hypothetical protein